MPARFALLLSILLWLVPAASRAQLELPTVEGPIRGGAGAPFLASTTLDLAKGGYKETEYFLSGTATSYTNLTELESDGRWSVAPAGTAPYKTRIVVRRPSRKRDFNGTVIVEWLNVSGGLDAAPDWTFLHTLLMRRGYAWVGVSAQKVGVEGGGFVIPGLPSQPLITADPERYGTLSHPGDSFSYDIFTQVARLIREPAGKDPLRGLKVEHVIAVGESQSAFRLVTYVNAVHPLVGVYDGFLVHSRGGGSAPLAEPPLDVIPTPSPAFIREDLEEPVLIFQTETDLGGVIGFFPDRQPDTDRIRLWEVAGTAHADTYTTLVGPTDKGKRPGAMEVLFETDVIPGLSTCPFPINSGPQHVVLKAALRALDRWVRKGRVPPSAPRLEASGPPVRIARDELGNALGGIRTPWVDVPIAAHAGDGQVGSILCLLFGTSTPLEDATLRALYPTHRGFVKQYRDATREALRGGWILGREAALMKRWARDSDVGR